VDASPCSILRRTGRSSASADVFAEGLDRPFGIAFYPNANPTWLYVAETNRVVRFAFKKGDVKARSAPEVSFRNCPPEAVTRSHIVFSPDGRRMFISVGSASNYAEQMPKKTVAQAKEWEATHAWARPGHGENPRRVGVRLGSKRPGKIFASGIRNLRGSHVTPKTGDLFGARRMSATRSAMTWCLTIQRSRKAATTDAVVLHGIEREPR